ncbi:MAG: hypothetical protein HYX75_13380 [Acidobacteria bacterium]|nr:hypothetical protein [Acidobacteriota bacterium]
MPRQCQRYARAAAFALSLLCLGVPARYARSDPDSTLPPEGPRDALVWSAVNDGIPTTAWIRATPKGYEVLSTREALVLSVGGNLSVVHVRTAKAPLCDCDKWQEAGFLEGPCPPAGETGSIQTLVAESLPAGKPATVSPRTPGPDENEATAWQSLEDQVTVQSSVGPYLFVVRSSSSSECGAIDRTWRSSFQVWTLETSRNVDILTPAERGALNAAARPVAFSRMEKERLLTDSAADLSMSAILTRYDPKAGLIVQYQFTAPACYACSDEWGSYSVSALVTAEKLPDSLRPYAEWPAFVQAYAKSRKDHTARGWTIVGGTPEEIERVLSQFKRIPESGSSEIPKSKVQSPRSPNN